MRPALRAEPPSNLNTLLLPPQNGECEHCRAQVLTLDIPLNPATLLHLRSLNHERRTVMEVGLLYEATLLKSMTPLVQLIPLHPPPSRPPHHCALHLVLHRTSGLA
jgi:hypothetical protein